MTDTLPVPPMRQEAPYPAELADLVSKLRYRPGWAFNRTVWHTWEHVAGTGNRWNVTGEAPNLTVSPSIWDQTLGSEWHGWIRNGVLEPA